MKRVVPMPDPYRDDYLKSRGWQMRRAGALARARNRCQLCGTGDKARLDVHHNSYERVGRELPSDLIVLCDLCHARFHAHGALSDDERQARLAQAQEELREARAAIAARAVEALRGRPEGMRFEEWTRAALGGESRQGLRILLSLVRHGATPADPPLVVKRPSVAGARRHYLYYLSEAGQRVAS